MDITLRNHAFSTLFIFLLPAASHQLNAQSRGLLPIRVADRTDITAICLTEIGMFGLWRDERPGVPAHLHTGIDIRRPGNNYLDEPVFSIAPGQVISIRDDGPFAQLIIEHSNTDSIKFWSVYEHIAGIQVQPGQPVDPFLPIARFMTRSELNRYGWQFDHLHLEIMQVKPRALRPSPELPHRYYASYNLECYSKTELDRYYLNPLLFLTELMTVPSGLRPR